MEEFVREHTLTVEGALYFVVAARYRGDWRIYYDVLDARREFVWDVEGARDAAVAHARRILDAFLGATRSAELVPVRTGDGRPAGRWYRVEAPPSSRRALDLLGLVDAGPTPEAAADALDTARVAGKIPAPARPWSRVLAAALRAQDALAQKRAATWLVDPERAAADEVATILFAAPPLTTLIRMDKS